MTAPAHPLAAVVAVLVALAPTSGVAQRHAARDRMTIVQVTFEPTRLGPEIVAEQARLTTLCGSGYRLKSPTCLSSNLRTVRERLSAFWSRPGAPTPLGYVVVRLTVTGGGAEQLSFALDVEWAAKPGDYQQWIDGINNSRYIDGWGVKQGEWVRLVGPPPLRSAWVPWRSDRFYVHAGSIAGEVMTLRDVRARPLAGGQPRILTGDFTIVEVRGDEVLLRTELPSDMICEPEPPGDEPPVVSAAPVMMSAPVSAFFDADGTPRFQTRYAKGC